MSGSEQEQALVAPDEDDTRPGEIEQAEDLMADLQEHIDHYQEAKRLSKEDPVDWFVEAHADLDAHEAAIKARYNHLREGLDGGCHGMLADIERRRRGLDWKHRGEIMQLVAERVRNKKQRHVKTFYGKVGFRRTPDRVLVDVRDEQAVMEACPDQVVTTRRLDKPALKKRLEEGQTIKGVRLHTVQGTDTFYIKTGGAKALEAEPPSLLPEKGTDE